MIIENIDIDKIKPYEKNPRKNDKAVEYVANSIKEFGFNVPILIDENNVIVAGHTRYKAAQMLKFIKVPCIKLYFMPEEKVKALRLVDNKVSELSRWDEDILQEELKQIANIDMNTMGFIIEDKEQSYEIDKDYHNNEVDLDDFETGYKYKCKCCGFEWR